MLQNRVDPYGQVICTAARGHWTGNRGVIHNDRKEIIRVFSVRPWITCLLQFKGRHRVVMTPNRWTELFFLDEATAFSAGHRPCAECRRDDFNRFKRYWTEGNPQHGFDLKTPIAQICLDKYISERNLCSCNVGSHLDFWLMSINSSATGSTFSEFTLLCR